MKRHRGFTLIELLLVLAILGIAAAVTLPTFVRSIRGNRLRAAARSVMAAGRYARSMAVLRQEEMTVTLDLERNIVHVGDDLKRKLDRVSIESVEIGAEVFMEEQCSILYRSNGRCDPHRIRIADRHGSWIEVDVDALSTPETESGT